MVDVQTVGVLVTAVSVSVAAIYYIINLRHNMKVREMEVCRLFTSEYTSEQGMNRYATIMTMEWKDHEDFMKKYGYSNPEMFGKWVSHHFMCETWGILIKSGVITAEKLYALGGYGTIRAWEKHKDIVQARRDFAWGHDYMINFEYLANEMLKIKMKNDASFKDKWEAYKTTQKL